MKQIAIVLACCLPLAACDSGPEVTATNASVEEVSKKVADAGGAETFVRPGKWKSQVKIDSFEMPGAPPEAAAAMSSLQNREQVHESCLTPEEAKRPKGDFFAGARKNCRYDHFNMGGGKIDAVMRCSGQGMGQTMAMQGTYSPDSYQMQMTMKSQGGPRPTEGMTMKMHIDAKRVGECDAKTS